jgi:signal transduction histidine kinase
LASPVVVGPVVASPVVASPVVASPVVASTALGGRCAVRADRRRLRQVLINLVTNGVRYNRAGGWVEVGTVDSETGNSGAGDSGASTVTVAVRDSGRGIPAEMMSRLFTPFDRLGAECSAEPGAGLGLVVARALMQTMGGTLEIRTAADAGTTAEIVLPAM